MKKYIVMFITLFLICSLVGCTNTSKKSSKDNNVKDKTEEKEVSKTSKEEDDKVTTKKKTSDKTDESKDSSESSKSESKSSSSNSSTTETKSTFSTKPAKGCSHNWVAETTTRYVVDKAAYDETIVVKEAWTETRDVNIFRYDGYKAYTATDTRQHIDYLIQLDVQNNYTCTKEVVANHPAETTVVHHDATGHNETITTGYHCSKCGAKK